MLAKIARILDAMIDEGPAMRRFEGAVLGLIGLFIVAQIIRAAFIL